MGRKAVDLKEIEKRPEAGRVAARLRGELTEDEAPLWGEEFAASGFGNKQPPPPSPPRV